MTPPKSILSTPGASSDSIETNLSEDPPQRKMTKSKKSSQVNKNSDDYRRRRERNNLAVKKSRNKSKIQTQQTLDRVQKLKAENEMLEVKIKILSKELSFLKDLFLAHAGNAHGGNLAAVNFKTLSDETEAGTKSPTPEV
ncbi:CCAAT/enhancer-binding protein gamma-like [Limulus polyphemus]|uniref:CCAAT/enhancer-binding protein gamma-like n=1 Tax=Limulus polyphemus TaxID=6850 RepID=A0ABM1BU99_LIMPO|nr:CCAAT/enhancer-binding protein gamma-like [Limulus polyphemus]